MRACVRACVPVCVCVHMYSMWCSLIAWFDSLRPSQQFFSHVRTGLSGLNQYKAADKYLAQGHNTVTPAAVRLEPATLRSLV